MNYSLHNGDCLVEMNKLQDNSVDMVLCDLPYGMTSCKWDCVIPFDKLWESYKRICKNNAAIVLFGSEPFSSYLRLSNIKWFKYDWIWHKNSSGGFATAKTRPMKYHEIISVFYNKQPVYNPQFQSYSDSTTNRYKTGDIMSRSSTPCNINNMTVTYECQSAFDIERGKYPESVQFFKSVPNSNGTKLHPTQKPVDLLEYLIKTYTNKGMTVLDNCMGSGSTGVACVNTNRNFIGIELDNNYYHIAADRIRDAFYESNNKQCN